MSILSSLYHGKIHNKPNDVHNVPDAERTGTAAGGAAQTLGVGADSAAQASGSGAALSSARQAAAGGWMNVSFLDESAMDAQLADAHAVALSDAFDHSHPAPRRTRESTDGNAVYQGASGRTEDTAAPRRTREHTDGSAVLPRHAERRIEALEDGHLRPPLYYTAQEQTPCASGVWESAHTVASKLESKEEFPQG